MKTGLISSRFLYEATNHLWSRFLYEAIGSRKLCFWQPLRHNETRVDIRGLLPDVPDVGKRARCALRPPHCERVLVYSIVYHAFDTLI